MVVRLIMKRPFLSLNFALSADGKISSVVKRPSGWTSRDDHARLLDLRKDADALLVGRGTLEADRMAMKAPSMSNEDHQWQLTSRLRLPVWYIVHSSPAL